jgi:hypothetical protein
MFDKTAISIGEQIIKLQERGLIVTENDNAAHYLSYQLLSFRRILAFYAR